MTDDRLNHLMNHVPERSILLLEDIDAAFNERKQTGEDQGYLSGVTFSGLLNALDGVASADERLIFMTTNHPERLDPALIRPGRVDYKALIDNATEDQVRAMFCGSTREKLRSASISCNLFWIWALLLALLSYKDCLFTINITHKAP